MGFDNPVHLAFLLIVVLLVFGARRLPELGRSLGSGMRGFKDAISGEEPSVVSAEPHERPALAAATAVAPADAGSSPLAADPRPLAADPSPLAADPRPLAADPSPLAAGAPARSG